MLIAALACYVVVSCSLYLVRAEVDYSSCTLVGSDKGRNADCPPDQIAVGLCTSGRDTECVGYYTLLHCCARSSPNATEEQMTLSYEGTKGEQLQCPSNYIVNAVCSSGEEDDCGWQIWTRIVCITSGIIAPTENCSWLPGSNGEIATCPPQQVLRGVCSSGLNADCDVDGSFAYTGIRCCTYV